MKNFWGMFGSDDENTGDRKDEGSLQLRKEELDVHKDRVKTGEVTLGKEVVEEHKSVDVPVTHEEVVIERRSLNERSDSPITAEQTIRIPVSEERVDVDKHTVVTGEISAHKRDVEETRHIDETLKKEEARINSEGDTKVITDDVEGSFH